MHKRYLAMLLVIVMAVSLCPAIPVFAADSGMDMVVDHVEYGWITAEPVNNGDGSVSFSIMTAGAEPEAKDLTTAQVYDMTNEDLEGMDAIDEANVVLTRIGMEVGRDGSMTFKPGVFAEVCYNAEGDVIDVRRVLQSGLFFDTAEFGGDLTKIGSTVMHRGAEGTGIMTGEAGDMVASGWVLDKGNGTITLGDGNMATELFIEEYNVASDVAVYEVDNATYESAASSFDAIPVTPAKNGVIYDTVSADRQFAIAIFDSDYTAYDEGTAEVVEIYYFSEAIADISSYVGLVPSSNRIGSDLSTADQGSPKPQSAPFLTSSEPFAVVEGKMWSVGDNEALNYLFYAVNEDGSYTLARYDTGWPPSGYMYWKADERALQELGGLDLDSRDINEVLLSHGHADQYGTSFDFWEMIVRAGGEAKVYETYEDGVGYDKYGFEDTVGALPTTEYAFRSIITDWYEMDKWLELGDGLACYPILTPGHSPGVASAVYQVTVGEGGMPDAHLTYDPETGERSITDYNEGDELFFIYMGGYGINGLQNPSKGYLRPAFISSLRYLQSVLPYLETTTGDTPDGIYNLPQHTNQFPYLEVQSMREMYNEKFDTDYSFLHFLREGVDEVANFAEKRASAMLYQAYDEKYEDMVANKAEGDAYPYMKIDGIDVKIDATNKDPATLFTVEESGPYKHEGGETVIQIDADSEIVVMHGYDPYLNKGGVEEGVLTNTASEGGSAKQNFDMSKGFLFAKDGFVTDPDAWYVQVCAHVMDGYDGNVYSDTGVNAGSEFTSGPVESFHGEGWVEIIRTEAMTKEEAEELAASLEKGAYYVVDLKKTGDINNAENVIDTFVPVDEYKSLPTEAIAPDPTDWYDSPLRGLYEIPVDVDNNTETTGDTRNVYLYVPNSNYPNQPVVHVAVPSGEAVGTFIAESGWIKLAEEEGILIYAYAANSAWGTYEAEETYLDTAYNLLTKRIFVDVRKHNMYMAAYGDAAAAASEFALRQPNYFAGLLTTSDVDEIVSAGDFVNGLSTFYNDEDKQLTFSEIVYPVWFATADGTISADTINFFKNANRTVDNYTTDGDTTYYAPDDSKFTELEYEAVGGIRITDIDDAVNYDFSKEVWLNMFECIRRYPSFGEVRSYIPSDEDPLFERYDAMVDGYSRFWYVYEPESVQSETDVPVMFVLHGNGGGPSEITDQTGWKMLADELGIILIAPQGSASWGTEMMSYAGVNYQQYTTTWTTSESETRPNDLEFIDYLMNWLTVDSEYAGQIDISRVYVTGQSMGGNFTNSLIKYRPEYFAAAAPFSWIASPSDDADLSVDIPVVNGMGQRDGTIKGGFSSANTMGDCKGMFEHFIDRYDLTEVGDLDRTYDDFTFMMEATDGTESICTSRDGGMNLYTFETEDGYPMFEAIEIIGMGHATIPTAVEHVWNDIMSHYSRDVETGVLYYDGEVVDTPTNLALVEDDDGGSAGGDTSKPSIRPGKDDDDDRPTDPSTGSDAIFEDIDGHWAESAIEYVYDEGLMNGISADEFSPDTATTRGMIVTMLYRLEGEPAVTAECPFDDVDAGDYYHDAVVWASENGIVNGISDTEYAPNANITREQLAAMMNRYAEFKGYDVSASTSLGGFADADDVSDYAVEALEWAVAEELVNGMGDNTVAPQGTATRAQVATIFQRFIENIA